MDKNKILLTLVVMVVLIGCATTPKKDASPESSNPSKALKIMQAAGLAKSLRDVKREDIDQALKEKYNTHIPSTVLTAGYASGFFTPPLGFSASGASAMGALLFLTSGEHIPAKYPYVISWYPVSEISNTVDPRSEIDHHIMSAYEQALPDGFRIIRDVKKIEPLFGKPSERISWKVVGEPTCLEDKCELDGRYFRGLDNILPEKRVPPDFVLGSSVYLMMTRIDIKVGFASHITRFVGQDMRDIWRKFSDALPRGSYVYIPPSYNDGVPVVLQGSEALYFIEPTD